MYDFAAEDCLFYSTCENPVSIGLLKKHRESPTNCVSRKLPLNLGLSLKI